MRHSIRNSKKKFLAAGVAVAVGAGMYGVGANWDYITTVADNVFSAEINDGSAVEGALLKVQGSAFSKTFNGTESNQTASQTWLIKSEGSVPAQFQASFALDATSTGDSAAAETKLAESVLVKYTVDGVAYDAGTLAAPLTLQTAMGNNKIDVINEMGATGDQLSVTVTVTLADPTVLSGLGVDADDTISISADWNVEYQVPTAP